MENLVEIIGVPGTGKTYYLSKIANSEATYIDFGSRLKQWLKGSGKQYNGPIPPNKYIKEFIETIPSQNTPTIITSHIVHYKNGTFFHDLDCERYAKASAYIFIYSEPKDILSRIEENNKKRIRKRDICSIEEIERHQELSLDVTQKLSQELGSRLLILNNHYGEEEKNILQIRKLLGELRK
ncbi:MAG: AAA family ATPase [Candidatus Pacearchaeota archaeon]|nr:AAA family ATPase [Candidatus Pacearchaeota archaeon]